MALGVGGSDRRRSGRGSRVVGAIALICGIVAVADPASARPRSATTLRCGSNIALAQPASDLEMVFNSVALPTRQALQANPFATQAAYAQHFAKRGLLVRGGEVDLVVPKQWRGRLAISWGKPQARTWRLRIPDCGPQTGNSWQVFAGGYWVRTPACVDLAVVDRATGSRVVVPIGVGASCPGQGPPPVPAGSSSLAR